MLDNKNHQWPLIVSAERSRVTSFLSKGPKMKWPCAKTAQADLTRGPGRLTCEKNFMRFGTPVGFTGCMRTKFFVFAKRQAAFEKKGFAACCSARLVPRRTFTGREEFFPTRMSREKQIQFYFVLCGGQNSTRFLVCLVGTLFLYPCLGEKKRAVKWPLNKYSIPNAPLSCQPISVNPHNFSRLPKSQAVILYNIPTCQAADPVLLYSQKRKTGNKPEGSVTVLRNQRSLDSIEKSFHIQVVLPYEKCMIDMCAE